MTNCQQLRLKKGEERRLNMGHLWVFSNEVDVKATPLADLEPGSEVAVTDYRGNILGCATVNPQSLICARLHARSLVPLDEELIAKRLGNALALRESLFDKPFYRLVHAEGDFLPGLVVDRFGSHFTVQVTTLAMEKRRDAVKSALESLFAPTSILWDNTVALRALEGLELFRTEDGACP